MAKQLNFEYKGKEYCLEYTRTTVRNMETMGFSTQDVPDKLMTRLPQLFEGAFMAHHSDIKPKLVREIYKSLPDKRGLMICLREMFADPYEELLAEPDEKNAIKWKANWQPEEETE